MHRPPCTDPRAPTPMHRPPCTGTPAPTACIDTPVPTLAPSAPASSPPGRSGGGLPAGWSQASPRTVTSTQPSRSAGDRSERRRPSHPTGASVRWEPSPGTPAERTAAPAAATTALPPSRCHRPAAAGAPPPSRGSPSQSLQQRGDGLLDLAVVRETAELLLREDGASVEGDLEDAAAAVHEFGVEIEPLLQLSRQTGGSGAVVSHHAVFDRHSAHRIPSLWWSVSAGGYGSMSGCAYWNRSGMSRPRKRVRRLGTKSEWLASPSACVPCWSNSASTSRIRI